MPPGYGGVVADTVDPEYEDLFRPDEVDPYEGDPDEAEPIEVGVVAAAIVEEPSVELSANGRLFRSQGVLGHADTMLAIPIGSRLKSLARSGEAAGDPRERIVPVTSTRDSSRSADLPQAPEPAESQARPGRPARADRAPLPDDAEVSMFGSSALPSFAIWLIIGGATLVAGVVNALLSGGHLGALTGLVLVLSTIVCALLAGRRDLFLVVIAPPLMFGLAAITAGQFFLSSAGGLLNRLVQVFFTLGENWYWVVAAVVAAIILMIVRRVLAKT